MQCAYLHQLHFKMHLFNSCSFHSLPFCYVQFNNTNIWNDLRTSFSLNLLTSMQSMHRLPISFRHYYAQWWNLFTIASFDLKKIMCKNRMQNAYSWDLSDGIFTYLQAIRTKSNHFNPDISSAFGVYIHYIRCQPLFRALLYS